jgi:hypothetical protein
MSPSSSSRHSDFFSHSLTHITTHSCNTHSLLPASAIFTCFPVQTDLRAFDESLDRDNSAWDKINPSLGVDGWNAIADALKGLTALTSLNDRVSNYGECLSICEGGQTEVLLQYSQLGLWAAQHLERSASTLTSLDLRCAAYLSSLFLLAFQVSHLHANNFTHTRRESCSCKHAHEGTRLQTQEQSVNNAMKERGRVGVRDRQTEGERSGTAGDSIPLSSFQPYLSLPTYPCPPVTTPGLYTEHWNPQ